MIDGPFTYPEALPVGLDDSRGRDELRTRLLAWYAVNRRALPWRGETDPYRILVSEMMLQQTGVERVKQYYERFLGAFPDFSALAAAPRVDVLRVWGGLGYNRRAVYLHECAKAVVERHGGILPADAEALQRLPGVGPYTRTALQSFAFGEDVATIDTNVRRVVGRLVFGGDASHSAVERAATNLVPAGRSSDWNQALMDFGSLQCTASNPACLVCPLRVLCAARENPAPRAPRKVAETAEPWIGSRRYLRGQIVARVRQLPPGGTIPLADLRDLLPDFDGEARLLELARSLAAHGLVRVIDDDEGARIGAPA
ncbi:MAG TPA: A/G-specific adenine glycosylase [Chloroflexota bacterium]|nr:A/G-specific adenine glycosylase [Chloroflexota bacterium]